MSVHIVAGWVVTMYFCGSTPMFWMIMLSPYSRSKWWVVNVAELWLGAMEKEATWVNKLQVLFTLSLDGGVWSASRAGCFIPWEIPPVSIQQEARSAPQLTITLWSREKFLLLLRID